MLRATQLWAPCPDNDRVAARLAIEQFYRLLKQHNDEPFEPAEAGRLVVDWWHVHREYEHNNADDRALVDALAELYSYVFGMPDTAVRPAAEQRAQAMRYCDQWVQAGCDLESPLIAQERAALVRSYVGLLAAVHQRGVLVPLQAMETLSDQREQLGRCLHVPVARLGAWFALRLDCGGCGDRRRSIPRSRSSSQSTSAPRRAWHRGVASPARVGMGDLAGCHRPTEGEGTGSPPRQRSPRPGSVVWPWILGFGEQRALSCSRGRGAAATAAQDERDEDRDGSPGDRSCHIDEVVREFPSDQVRTECAGGVHRGAEMGLPQSPTRAMYRTRQTGRHSARPKRCRESR